jgi:hypothetical protein
VDEDADEAEAEPRTTTSGSFSLFSLFSLFSMISTLALSSFSMILTLALSLSLSLSLSLRSRSAALVNAAYDYADFVAIAGRAGLARALRSLVVGLGIRCVCLDLACSQGGVSVLQGFKDGLTMFLGLPQRRTKWEPRVLIGSASLRGGIVSFFRLSQHAQKNAAPYSAQKTLLACLSWYHSP